METDTRRVDYRHLTGCWISTAELWLGWYGRSDGFKESRMWLLLKLSRHILELAAKAALFEATGKLPRGHSLTLPNRHQKPGLMTQYREHYDALQTVPDERLTGLTVYDPTRSLLLYGPVEGDGKWSAETDDECWEWLRGEVGQETIPALRVPEILAIAGEVLVRALERGKNPDVRQFGPAISAKVTELRNTMTGENHMFP